MTLLICGIISIVIFAAALTVAILLRKDLRVSVRVLTVGMFVTIFVALAPCHIEQNGYSFGVNLFDTICVMITQSSLTGSLETISQYQSPLVDAYRVYLICLYVLGPLSAASATLSFVKGFGRLIYRVKSAFADSYIFTTVNERSIAVCKSIRNKHRKAVILFAIDGDAASNDENAISQIESLGGIIVNKSVKDINHSLRHKRHYCLLDKNGSNNIDLGLAINDKYKDNKLAKSNVELLIYSTDEMSQIIFYNTPHNVTMHLFREEEIIANGLIFDYPLYGGIVDNKLNVLLIGAGKIGYEILKKVIWSSYFGKKVKTQINVLDSNAKSVEARLKKECPALFTESNVDLQFHKINVNDDSFTAVLDKIDAPTYIVVALGNEKFNAETAIYLRRHYGLKNGYPKIRMTTDTEDYAEKLQLLTVCDWSADTDRSFSPVDSAKSFEIDGFGSYESAYKHIYPLESDFGRLALACHEVKLETSLNDAAQYIKPDETVEQFAQSLAFSYNQIFFYKNNADQLALSIGYILYMLGYHEKSKDYLQKVKTDLGVKSVADIPLALYVDSNYDFASELKQNINEIMDIATERYNRFMYTLGWTNLPVTEIENKVTRDQLRLKYARLGNYDVDALEKLMNEGAENTKDYRKNDKDELLKLPVVLQLYEQISKFNK